MKKTVLFQSNKDYDKKKRFFVSRWILLSAAILLNAFIIVYSCLDGPTTSKMNSPFTNFLVSLVNGFTKKEAEQIKLEGINISLSNEESYKYNYLPGYDVDEIPLGSAKQIECFFTPTNATNKSVVFSASPADAVTLNQSGSTISVVGMKTGLCEITGKSSDGAFESKVNVKVVDAIAPTSFNISLESTTIPLGTTQTINLDIDGGVLGHDELVNFRYYDARKLSYLSSNESVAAIDEYGVIKPISTGNATIVVANGALCSKSINVSVVSGSTPTPYSNLSISGSNVCYANDMILSQSSSKYKYQLTPKDGETELNPEDFIWKSSNDLLVKVDKHGVMRGFRKASNEDETATITAVSKTTGQSVNYNVTVKNQLPTELVYWIIIDDEMTWNPEQFTLARGELVNAYYQLTPRTQVNDILIEVSNKEVLEITNVGTNLVINAKNVGTSHVKMTAVINPDLVIEVDFTVVEAGAINTRGIGDVGKYIRKSIGHAALFMVAQIFTYLTLYMFFYDKKWWFYSSISIGEGLFISGLSELIQVFVPSRGGAFVDVLIDFAGVVVGAALTFLGIYIVKKIKGKKSRKETSKNN